MKLNRLNSVVIFLFFFSPFIYLFTGFAVHSYTLIIIGWIFWGLFMLHNIQMDVNDIQRKLDREYPKKIKVRVV